MSVANRWLWLAVVLFIGWLLYLLNPILSPFLVSCLIAYLGDPLVDRLERAGFSRTGGVIVVFVLITLLLLALPLIVVPMLGNQLVRLYELLPSMLQWLQGTALPWLQVKVGLQPNLLELEQLKTLFSNNIGTTTDVLTTVLSHATSSGLALMAWLGNLFLIPVVAFYLLRDFDLLIAKLRRLIPRDYEARVVSLVGECHEVLGAFMRGQLLVMLALAVIYSVGLMLVGVELGLLIGAFAGLASIVPYMGFIVGIGIALAVALFQFGLDPYVLSGIGVVFMVGQLLESMVLTPLLVGDRIGLHPVAVIFAILAGGQLFGFTGVLLALPVAAVIMVLMRHVHDLYKLSDIYGESTSGPDKPPSAE